MAALSAVLLDFASKLRALAVDGIVEGSATELAGGIPLRTFRYRLAALVEAKALTRENHSGGRIRLCFGRAATESGNSATRAATRAASAATGGERGGPAVSIQPKDSTKEKQRQRQAEQVAALQERQERTATLPEGSIRVIVEGPPHLVRPVLASIAAMEREAEPRVSPERAAVDDESEARELSARGREALAWRVEQQAKVGFKKTREAFERHMRRVLLEKPREIDEILDEKREHEEALGRTPKPVAPSAGKPVEDGLTPAQVLEWQKQERLRKRIQQNGAASR